MKTTIRLPLGQFEFIEQSFDMEMTPEAAVDAFNALQNAYKGGEGLTEKQLDEIIKKMMLGVSVPDGVNLWSQATPAQKLEINRVKRILKQIKNKVEESEVDYEDGPKDQTEIN